MLWQNHIISETPGYHSIISINESNFDLDTTGLAKEEIVQSIWDPGSNGIEIGSQWSDSEIPEYSTGGLNYSTQPGVGWSKQINGLNVTGFSLQSNGGWHNGEWSQPGGDQYYQYLTIDGFDNDVQVSLPDSAYAVIYDLENVEVVADNKQSGSKDISFTPSNNVRYGGYAWYGKEDNLEIHAKSTLASPVKGKWDRRINQYQHRLSLQPTGYFCKYAYFGGQQDESSYNLLSSSNSVLSELQGGDNLRLDHPRCRKSR